MGKVIIVHPSYNLIKRVVKDILNENNHQNITVVFPHRRPIAFFQYYFSQEIEHPCILPDLLPFEDWALRLFVNLHQDPATPLNEYDQAWLVYQIARKILKEVRGSEPEWEDFFAWALRIVNLFKEFDMELVTPQNLIYPPEEITSPKAAELLQVIREIYLSFSEKLQELNYTTQAKIIRFLAENDFPPPENPVYLVGFYALTEAEDRLLRKFYEKGARIYWHADPENLPKLYERWRSKWKIEPEKLLPKEKTEPDIFLFEAHDLHAELKELKSRLPERIDYVRPDCQAIVPFAIENIIPLAHHLPEGHVNLTMGYPFNLTGIYTFLESLFNLILKKDFHLGYRTSDFVDFLKTSYLTETQNIEKKLINYGNPYLSREEIADILSRNCGANEKDKLDLIFDNIINPVEEAATTRELALALRKVFDTISQEGTAGIYEKEFMGVFLEKIIPILEESLFSGEEMEKRGLISLVKQIISSVRIPFEGHPLCGLQVMGALETRLLSFDEVFLLDVNEEIVPGIEEINPLMPHQVKRALGLPDREREELITKYHFERLIASSRKVHIFWQIKTTKSGEAISESRKAKSRYVEKLIWEIEKKHGKRINNLENQSFFKKSTITIQASTKSDWLTKSEHHKNLLRKNILGRPISPTLLQQYLNCPLKFLYSYILNLKTPEIADEIAYDQLGSAAHAALQEYFNTLTNGKLPAVIRKQDLNIDDLLKCFVHHIEKQRFYRNLSNIKKTILKETVKFRFKKYIENHPDETEITAIEEELKCRFSVKELDLDIELFGRVDRVDRRDNVFIILDYKTGKAHLPEIRKISSFNISELKNQDKDALKNIIDHIPDIQLLFYIHLFCTTQRSKDGKQSLQVTGAYVDLSKTGEEKFIIQPGKPAMEDFNNWMQKNFSELLEYIIHHMLNSPHWYDSVDESSCKYCEYSVMCRYSA